MEENLEKYWVPEKPDFPKDNSAVLPFRLGNKSTPPDPHHHLCGGTVLEKDMESGMWQDVWRKEMWSGVPAGTGSGSRISSDDMGPLRSG